MQKYKTHGAKDTITLTVSMKVKKDHTKCIPEYRATKMCKMLPLQKLDEK